MNKIKEYLRFLRRIRIIKYFYLNYFCKEIIRVDNSKIIPYKNAVINIEIGARIYIANGDVEIGCNLLKGSRGGNKNTFKRKCCLGIQRWM